jgi:polysaccharide biosynthesis protein PslG
MKKFMKGFWPSTLLLVLASTALADKLPDLTLPAGVGVNVHFTTGHEKDLDMIAAAGFKIVRMDFLWKRIEHDKGKYDWSEYDAFTSELERHGLRPYYILDYSNPLYEKGKTSPQHPESIAAYARWAAAAAEHFRGRDVIWEIWNEPNNPQMWKPEPNAAQYAALALATAKAMRATDPQACIVAPASVGFPWDFFETVFKSGLLNYLDAVSVHPYRAKPPETAAADFARLRALIASNAPPGKTIPILSGEWGYSTSTAKDGVSLEKQAAYIARQQLSNLLNGVPISIWYDWKDDGTNREVMGQNRGTVSYDLKPKPDYFAIQTLTRELSGYRITRRDDTGNPNDFVLVLTNMAGQTKLAAWTVGKPHDVRFGSKMRLKLDAMPKYVVVP